MLDHIINWLEKHLRRYAVSNLSLIVIICYGFGYVLQAVNADFLSFLTLNPYAILHGQIWRLITWVLVPPDGSNFVFVLIAMLFYYSIGTALERVWGTWEYNLYIFSGLFFTILGAFLHMGMAYLTNGGTLLASTEAASSYFALTSYYFSTYYVCMSIFFGYAATFPDATVLFMFILPLKVKWLGIAYAVILGYEFITYAVSGYYFVCIAIAASLVNFLIFFWRTRRSTLHRFNPKEMKRRADFRRAVSGTWRGAQTTGAPHTTATGRQSASRPTAAQMRPAGRTHHRCAICGRTELDDPTLEFRYCSKCEGSYEFCQDHLFHHVHAVSGQGPKAMDSL